jgi:hypothetical protein
MRAVVDFQDLHISRPCHFPGWWGRLQRAETWPEMKKHRFCQIVEDGKVVGPSVSRNYDSDEAAIARAKLTIDSYPIEVWEGSRLVATVRPAPIRRIALVEPEPG